MCGMNPTLDSPPLSAPATAVRSDGIEARNRLLDAALCLFAEKGFAKTSTREIAQAAQVNIAAISYYFGDKAGLYRGVFQDQRCNPGPEPALLEGQFASLTEVLRAILLGFTEPIKQGQLVQSCMRLHFREMLEPTGVWQDEIDNTIKPAHLALVRVLCQHLELAQADDDIHRLAFAIAGLGMMLHIGSEVIPALRPALTATPEAVDIYAERLLGYAQAMVQDEARRRGTATNVAPPATPSTAPPTPAVPSEPAGSTHLPTPSTP
jgi:AcrR family transcriptional regulator